MQSKRQNRLRDVAAQRQRGIIIVLEDIHDPHNVAAILRTCDAFGVGDVALVYEKEQYANPKRVGKSSSSSANKWLDFMVYRSSEACAAALTKKGYAIYATTLGMGAVPIEKANFAKEPIALVVGNEHRGVSDAMRQAAEVLVHIPMRGMVQSLNVSVTAAICLYELTRQWEASGKDFLLSAKEQKKLVKDFLER
jgi:tRNA (guanosine-2'-O-)-methyltransferase